MHSLLELFSLMPEAGRGATFSRIRYFDTFSVEDAVQCIQNRRLTGTNGNWQYRWRRLSIERGEASFHRYEYVKAAPLSVYYYYRKPYIA